MLTEHSQLRIAELPPSEPLIEGSVQSESKAGPHTNAVCSSSSSSSNKQSITLSVCRPRAVRCNQNSGLWAIRAWQRGLSKPQKLGAELKAEPHTIAASAFSSSAASSRQFNMPSITTATHRTPSAVPPPLRSKLRARAWQRGLEATKARSRSRAEPEGWSKPKELLLLLAKL